MQPNKIYIMLSQMRPICRATLLLGRALKLNNHKIELRSISFKTFGNDLLLTTKTTLPGLTLTPQGSAGEPSEEKRVSDIDRKIPMIKLNNSLSSGNKSLKLAKNRSDLVVDFYNLAKYVIDGDINVNALLASKTFKSMEDELERHIDMMKNSQVVNILSSLLKMGVNPSTSVVNLLEHEVKFRIETLSISQVMKLIKFYNSIEMSHEQSQLICILSERIRYFIHSENIALDDLLEILQSLNKQQFSSDYFSLIEERILNILTENSEDEMIIPFIKETQSFDYWSLCRLFIYMAANNRRPTPILKSASNILLILPYPKTSDCRADVIKLVETLQALNSLSYPYRALVSKLVNDLISCIRIENLDVDTQCNILRTLDALRWRSEKLMKMYFDYICLNYNHPMRIDHNLLSTLLYTTAKLNYKPEIDLKDFYNRCEIREHEFLIENSPRKWLNYVWALALIDIVNESHLRSVINDSFIKKLESPMQQNRVSHSDRMKLLNLRAIAHLEYDMNNLDVETLDELAKVTITRGSDFQKLSAKVKEALSVIVSSEADLRTEVHTPFGFVIDCELNLDKNGRTLPLESSNCFLSGSYNRSGRDIVVSNSTRHKCALIYILFDETVANYSNEVLGHKQIIKRILNDIGYKTVFIHENLLSREKTSAGLIDTINKLVKEEILGNNL